MPSVAEMVNYQERLDALKLAGFWNPEEAARFDALHAAEYVIVRIDGDGERWRCNRCNAKHTHFTLMCVERPFKGLRQGLKAYWANVGSARSSDLSPSQRERLDVLAPLFGGRPIPLANGHPLTAAGMDVPDRDVMVGALILGSIEPISKAKATLLASIINSRAGQRAINL
jgi:hypothetical protein